MMEPFLTEAPKADELAKNPIREARVAAGITLKQLAAALDITYKGAWSAENRKFPTVEMVERVMEAIFELTGKPRSGAVSYPNPVKVITISKAATGAAFDHATTVAPASAAVVDDDDEDEDYDEEEDDEDGEYDENDVY
jgi:transcriptional regulator with XRE-family HTH domain